jgi:hypothetical protein
MFNEMNLFDCSICRYSVVEKRIVSSASYPIFTEESRRLHEVISKSLDKVR